MPSYAGKREISISKAAVHLSKGQLTEAAILLRPLIDSQCHDMVVLKLLSDIYFYQGASHQIKALVDLDAWDNALIKAPYLDKCFGYALGARAFGLLEVGELEFGRKSAEAALMKNPADVWSIHAMSHYYEMSNDYGAAITWVRSIENVWSPPEGDVLLNIHMWWHTALFYVGDNQLDVAMSIYEEKIKGKNQLMDLADASSLLWRLELRGRQIEQAWWDEVATIWSSSLNVAGELSPNTYSFNLIHLALALTKSQLSEHSKLFVHVMKQILKFVKQTEELPLMDQSCLHPNALATRNVCLGVQAFVLEDYAESFRLLNFIVSQLQLMGGSTPQRAIFRMICKGAAKRLNSK
jgi:tetratricopeptide (TPR) repeat protein